MNWKELNLSQLEEAIAAKQKELGDIFAAHESVEAIPAAEAEKVKPLNDELSDMVIRRDELAELADAKAKAAEYEEKKRTAVNRPDHPNGGDKPELKDLGQMFIESAAFKMFAEEKKANIPVELPFAALGYKGTLGTDSTLATVDSEYAVQNIRLPGILEPREQPNIVAALFSQATTTQQAIVYMSETTTTNAAATVDEGAAKPESTIGFSEATSPVRKIATWLPVTEEAFADVPALRSYVNDRLRVFVQQEEDDQLLNGDGIAPNIQGVLNTPGILTQAKAADPTPDAIHKAMTQIWTNSFFVPDAMVMHPSDWEEVRLLRTADGIYIWGSPADPGVARVWGVPVTQTTRIAAGTGLIGAFRVGGTVYRRAALTLRVADQHASFAVENKIALIVEERLGLVIFRPTAFATVTGI